MTRLFQAMAGARHGGAEAFFTRLAIALQRDGQEQSVVIRHDRDRAALLRAAHVPVTELPFGRWLDLRTGAQLKRLLSTLAPEVVLTWMNRASAALPAGDYVHVGRLGGYYDLKYYRRCHHLIGNTPDIVDHLVAAGWPKGRAHYIPNFVDATPGEPVPRDSLNTPEETKIVLALGRLHPNKAFDVLIGAMAQVPGVHLWLAGEGPERPALERQTASLELSDRVHLLGWRDDAVSLMAAADLLVCPSRHEPLGNVILEAWAHRLPVVAAASQGPSQLIADNVSGRLVPIDDADAMATAIRDLLADPDRGRALAEAGFEAYRRDYSERAVVAAYRHFLDMVAA